MPFASRVRRFNAGAGGKILRGRRPPPPASPYSRSSASGRQSWAPAWVTGVVAGAGNLLSSLFGSDIPSASTSYSCSTDGDSAEDDMDVSSEPGPSEQTEKKLNPVKDQTGAALAIISEIDPKQAIEQLVMRETFSRDESNKLIKIIETRVVDVGDSLCKGLKKNTCNAVDSNENWKSRYVSRRLPDMLPCFSGKLNAISPRSSDCQVVTAELQKPAIREAKQWFEDKELASDPETACRPRTLDTKMCHYDSIVEEGSPIDVAKSYMRSLSSWRSPFCSFQFEKSSSTNTLVHKDEAPLATPESYIPSVSYKTFKQGLKRDHHSAGSRSTLDEIRRVRWKSSLNGSDNPGIERIYYSSEDERKIPLGGTEVVQSNSSKLPVTDSLDEPTDSAVKHAKDNCTDEVFGVPERLTEGTCPVRPHGLNFSPGVGSYFCDLTIPNIVDNQEPVQGNCVAQEQVDRLSNLCTTGIDKPVEHPDSRQKERNYQIQAATQQDLSDPSQNEVNGLRYSTNGPSPGLTTNVVVAPSEELTTTILSTTERATGTSGRTEILGPNTGTTNIPVTKIKTIIRARTGARGGTRMKGVKDMTVKSQPSTSRGRGRRGRGKPISQRNADI